MSNGSSFKEYEAGYLDSAAKALNLFHRHDESRQSHLIETTKQFHSISLAVENLLELEM